MTSPDMDDEAMKAMADRIADKMYPRTHPGWIGGQACALAAIIETRDRDAALADDIRRQFGSPTGDAYTCGLWDQGIRIAAAIRSGQHYGKDHPHA